MLGLTMLVVVSLLDGAHGIVGGKPAAAPEPDAAVVFIQKFDRNARVEGVKNDAKGYYTFLGLRYAEPPVGSRRFARAAPSRLEGEVTARKACQPCAQPDPRISGRVIGSEDCLCINIYAPKMPGDERGSPVLFWVHGGGFRFGSASYYGGEHLAQKDTILVSVQYRLGSLGFLSNGQRDMSGNIGLLDLSVALQWVLDYVEFFGGDPGRVVTIGQGSGGSAASLLALSPLSGDGVRGVAALSGAPLSPAVIDRSPRERSLSVAEHTGCPKEPASALVHCLRGLPLEKIIEADSKVKTDIDPSEGFLSDASGRTGSGVSVEGVDDERALPPVVQEPPEDSLDAKRRGKKRGRETVRVPLLTGVVRDETAHAVFGKNAQSLMEKLLKVPDFINKGVVGPLKKHLQGLLPKELQSLESSTRGLLNVDTYYNFMSQGAANVTQGLFKIIEATGDAFFNFPAFKSVDRWSEQAPAFLYRFEYKGNKTKGRHFLAGLPLVGASGDEGDHLVGHGDELAYLFEPLDADAKPLTAPTDISTQDDRVRDLFTDLIARFAHNASLAEDSDFRSGKNRFLQIGDRIEVSDDFRLCEMAMWGNIEAQLQQATCTQLAQLSNQLTNIPSAAANVLSGAANKIPGLSQPSRKPSVPKMPPNFGGNGFNIGGW